MDSICISKVTIVTDADGVDYVSLQVDESAPMWGVHKETNVNFQATPGYGETWVEKMLPNTSYDIISRQTGVVKKVEK